jgi:hypothetical protein
MIEDHFYNFRGKKRILYFIKKLCNYKFSTIDLVMVLMNNLYSFAGSGQAIRSSKTLHTQYISSYMSYTKYGDVLYSTYSFYCLHLILSHTNFTFPSVAITLRLTARNIPTHFNAFLHSPQLIFAVWQNK